MRPGAWLAAAVTTLSLVPRAKADDGLAGAPVCLRFRIEAATSAAKHWTDEYYNDQVHRPEPERTLYAHQWSPGSYYPHFDPPTLAEMVRASRFKADPEASETKEMGRIEKAFESQLDAALDTVNAPGKLRYKLPREEFLRVFAARLKARAQFYGTLTDGMITDAIKDAEILCRR